MKDRELDEFGSIFRRAIIPTIEVSAIEIRVVVVLFDFSDRGSSCMRAARELVERFDCRVSCRFLLREADARWERDARGLLEEARALPGEVIRGAPAAHIVRITKEDKPSLIIAPAPLRAHEMSAETVVEGGFVDSLLVATAIPTLLVREPLPGLSLRPHPCQHPRRPPRLDRAVLVRLRSLRARRHNPAAARRRGGAVGTHGGGL